VQVPFRARGVHRDVQARIVELFEGSDRITPGGGADEVRSEENLAELFGIERCHFHGIVKQWRKQLVSRRTADERASIKKALKQFLRDKAGEVISLRELEALRRRTGLTRNELVQRLGFSKNDLLESLQVPLLDEEGGGGVGGAGDDAEGAFSSSSNLPAEDQVLIRLFNEAQARESKNQQKKRKKNRRRERKRQRKKKAAAEGRAVGWGSKYQYDLNRFKCLWGNTAASSSGAAAMLAGMLPAFLVDAVVALRRAAGFVDSGTGGRGEYAMDKNTRSAADAAEQDGWEDDDDDEDENENDEYDDDDDDEDDDADADVDAGVGADADVEDAGAEGDTEQDRLRALQRVAAWADEDQLMPLTSGGKSAAAMEAEVFVRSLLERHGGQGGTGYDNGLVAGVDFWTEEHLKEGFAKTTRGEPVDPELVLVINSLMFQYRRAPPRRPAAASGGAGGGVKRLAGRARRPKGVSRRQWRRKTEDEQYETAKEGSPTQGKEGQASQAAKAQAQAQAQTPAKPTRPRGVSRREWRDMTVERRCALVEANRKDDSQLTWGIATPDIIFRQPVLLREPGGEEGGRVGEGKGASSVGRLVRFIEVKNT
jgi:hypothetical protein